MATAAAELPVERFFRSARGGEKEGGSAATSRGGLRGPPPLTQRQEAYFDPTLWGTPGQGHLAGVPAPTAAQLDELLPRRQFGKWVGATAHDYFRIVPGDDAAALARGFTPLAAGLGAIELQMPGRDVKAGQAWFDSGEWGTDLDLWFDRARLGQVSDGYMRYYVLLGDGWEPNDGDFRQHFMSSAANAGKYPEQFGGDPQTLPWRATDLTGKFFGGLQQQTSGTVWQHYDPPASRGAPEALAVGGGYGVSSGLAGYQGRMRFQQGLWREGFAGPAVGGASLGVELYDFGPNAHAIPSQTGITGWDGSWESSAHLGGMGFLYPYRWYCFELRWHLNSLTPYVLPPEGTDYREAGFLVDGFLEFFVDGCFAGRSPLFATRSARIIDWALQVASGAPFDTEVGSPARLRPLTNVPQEHYLGFASVAGNLYYGGRSPNPRDKYVYLNGIVAATDYIGPMLGVTREDGGLGPG